MHLGVVGRSQLVNANGSVLGHRLVLHHPASLLALYREGLAHFEAGGEVAGLAAWGRLADGAPGDLSRWLAVAGAERARSPEGRRLALARLRQEVAATASPFLLGELWEAIGDTPERREPLPGQPSLF